MRPPELTSGEGAPAAVDPPTAGTTRPVPGAAATDVVAAFDFDGTLTRTDTVVDFLVRACGGRRVAAALVRSLAAERSVDRKARTATSHRDRIKERLSVELLGGRPMAELEEIGAAFAREVHEKRLRPHMLGRLQGHKAAGHSVVIVSASYSFYLDPLGQALGVDAVLCTRVEADRSGVCTGRLVGGNCRGATKVARLQTWAEGRPHELHAYGDSPGDAELLASAAVATWVKRSRKAR